MPSTVIRSFNYDPLAKELEIVFQSGRRYIYEEVPEEVFSAMKAAFAKGEFFNARIRDQFPFRRENGKGEGS
jgi:hypothetical protein